MITEHKNRCRAGGGKRVAFEWGSQRGFRNTSETGDGRKTTQRQGRLPAKTAATGRSASDPRERLRLGKSTGGVRGKIAWTAVTKGPSRKGPINFRPGHSSGKIVSLSSLYTVVEGVMSGARVSRIKAPVFFPAFVSLSVLRQDSVILPAAALMWSEG